MRLCAVAVVACLLVGAGVQSAAAGGESTATPDDPAFAESTATPDDPAFAESADDSDSDQSDDTPLALGISPKRALVSLAFLGAVAARKRREPT